MMFITTLYFLLSAAFVSAWLPGEHRDIVSSDGNNLFIATPSYTFNSSRTVTGRRATKRFLPGSNQIRGVNLGSLFILEPWMASNSWNDMGCGPYKSEFDCVSGLGQAAANAAFQNHWNSWITQGDIATMQSYGLNTIRVPVGYWMREDIVYPDSEHFPQGGFSYLERLCGWARDAGMYVIIDLHGAPGAQAGSQPFTGQYAPDPGFYVDWQFERALKFLEWMTNKIHTSSSFSTVGMIEIVNEPLQDAGSVSSMRSSYYPSAFQRIRAAESALGISGTNQLHIQMMNAKWGTGEPTQYLTNNYFAAYDDHRYLKWSGTATSQANYISTSCSDDRGGNWPLIVGEWSLSVPDNVQWNSDWNPYQEPGKTFYKRWFAAQVSAYERQSGWIFWNWKTELGDLRWSYSEAVSAGVIPANLNSVYGMGVC